MTAIKTLGDNFNLFVFNIVCPSWNQNTQLEPADNLWKLNYLRILGLITLEVEEVEVEVVVVEVEQVDTHVKTLGRHPLMQNSYSNRLTLEDYLYKDFCCCE